MYLFLTLFAGALISLLSVINGTLTANVGLYLTTVIIHIVAIVSAIIILAFERKHPFPTKRLPLWMYASGLISVCCTLCSNYAFGKISLVAITALGLLSQTVTSLIIDHFGLLGANKRRTKAITVICLCFSLIGIVYMLGDARLGVLSAIVASLLAGVGLVVSRMISSTLAEHSGAVASSLINHIVGLPLAIILMFIMGKAELAALPVSLSSTPVWSYIGGFAGLMIIVITNVVLPRVSSFQVSLLLFVGQVFSGAAIDLLLGAGFSARTFYGGVLIALGILAGSLFSRLKSSSQK